MKALRQAAADTGKSIAELIRQGVDRFLATRIEPTREERIERAIRAAGRFSSGLTDVSANPDRYLAEAGLLEPTSPHFSSPHPSRRADLSGDERPTGRDNRATN